MTKVQTWAMAGIAAIALAVGALLISGAVTSAQTPTQTPVPSQSSTSPTPKGHNGNCPNMGNNSGGAMHYGPSGSSNTAGFHGHQRSATTTVSTHSGT